MSRSQRTEMDSLEIADFLETQQTGVLSLAQDDDGYGIPVSFAFDEEELNVYLRLGYGPTSTKRAFVDAVERASFLVYARTDDGWKSVLARGHLAELSEDSLDSATVQATRDLKIPYYRVFEDSAEELQFAIVRMAVTELTGIVSGGGGSG